MAPLTDRSANRQSRIPVVGADSVSRSRINNENLAPGPNLTRLLAPTKSSVARTKSPSPIPLPINPITNGETLSRGRLGAVASNDSLNAAYSRRQSFRRPSPSPVTEALHAHKADSPMMLNHKSLRLSRPSSSNNRLIEMQDKPSQADQNKPLPIEKPLPSRPVATSVGSLSPTKDSRGIIDAADRPLIKSPGTPQEEEWPVLSPERPSSRRNSTAANRSPSIKRKLSSRLPRSSIHNSPAVVSPILAQLPVNPTSPPVVSAISTPTIATHAKKQRPDMSINCNISTDEYPPRSSSLHTPEPENTEFGLGISATDSSLSESNESHEHRYLPTANNFSRPRVIHTDRSPASAVSTPVSQTPVYAEPKTSAVASPIPIASPKKTPSIVEIAPAHDSLNSVEKLPVADDVLTFAGRRLGNSTDLAALDQGSARSSRRRANTVRSSPPKSNLSLHDLPPRVPTPAEPSKLSPIRFIFGDKGSNSEEVVESSRVKKLSGCLSSSSFAGSTLTISDEADHLILGPQVQSSLTTPIDAEFDLPSPSSNGFHVSWPDNFGFNVDDIGQTSPTVQSSPSVRNESTGFPSTFGRISEEQEPSDNEATLDVELSLSVSAPDGSAPAQKTIRAPIADVLAAAINKPQDDGLPGATIAADDERTEQHITATLSILQGTPVKHPSEEYSGLADDVSKKAQRTKEQLKEAQKQSSSKAPETKRSATSVAPSKSLKTRLSMPKLPRATSKDKDESSSRPRNDRLPSYMLPTPASEARKTSVAPTPDVRRNNTSQGLTPNTSSRRASQAARLSPTPTSDRGRLSPSSRQTTVSERRGAPQSGRSTPNSDISHPSQTDRATLSSDLRSTTPTSRPSTARQPSYQGSTKSSASAANEPPTLAADTNNRASLASRHVPMAEIARDSSSTPSTRPRSESKGKSVLNNLKGFFSTKRDVPSTPGTSSRRFSIGSRRSVSMEPDVPDVPDVPALPSLPDSRKKSTTKSILIKKDPSEDVRSPTIEVPKESSSVLPRSRRKSTVKNTSSKMDIGSADDEKPTLRRKASRTRVAPEATVSDADSEKEKRDTVALMEMGLTLRQEAFKEDDLVRKERMTSFAQVVLDTVTNAVEAERNMYAAMQAAEQAKMSYMMTQQSVQEMNKLVSTSRRLPLFKRKKQPANGA